MELEFFIIFIVFMGSFLDSFIGGMGVGILGIVVWVKFVVVLVVVVVNVVVVVVVIVMFVIIGGSRVILKFLEKDVFCSFISSVMFFGMVLDVNFVNFVVVKSNGFILLDVFIVE